jgi:hypothetical protein
MPANDTNSGVRVCAVQVPSFGCGPEQQLMILTKP